MPGSRPDRAQPPPMGIGARLEQARSNLHRLAPAEVPGRLAAGAVLVDIRPAQQRMQGEIPGAHIVERNVLEWRFDPSSEAALPIASHALEVIVICQEGYQSSLAAESLIELGVTKATDVIGGFEAWQEQGLDVIKGGAEA
jgi:rhodanese-related sulfurtransferase